MQPAPAPGDEGGGDRPGQRLAFAGEHLDDAAVPEGQRGGDLHRVGFLAGFAPGDLAHQGAGAEQSALVLPVADEDLAHVAHGLIERRLGVAADGAGEGVDLRVIEPGDYEIICMPLKYDGGNGDGAPARTMLRELA